MLIVLKKIGQYDKATSHLLFYRDYTFNWLTPFSHCPSKEASDHQMYK